MLPDVAGFEHFLLVENLILKAVRPGTQDHKVEFDVDLGDRTAADQAPFAEFDCC